MESPVRPDPPTTRTLVSLREQRAGVRAVPAIVGQLSQLVVDLFAASVCIPIYHGMSSVLDSPLVRNKTATDEYLPVILCVVTTSVVSLVVFITAAIYMLSMQSQLLLRAFYRTGDVFQTRKLDWELLKRILNSTVIYKRVNEIDGCFAALASTHCQFLSWSCFAFAWQPPRSWRPYCFTRCAY
eukprot:1195667-Prorocentrum_minimum.AAC.20